MNGVVVAALLLSPTCQFCSTYVEPAPPLWTACSHAADFMPDAEPNARSGGRWIKYSTGGIAVLVALHSAVWLVATGWLEAEIPNVVARAAASGWTVQTGQNRRAGWPWVASVRVTGVVASRTVGETALQWTAEQLDVTLAPSDPTAVQVSARGEQDIGLGSGPGLHCRADRAVLRAPFAGALWTYEAHDLRIEATDPITAGHVTGTVTSSAVEMSATDVNAVPPFPSPFGMGLAMSIAVSSTPPLPTATPSAAAVAAWQAQGGRVTVPSLEVRWGPLQATGSGAATLDAQLQPVGQAMLFVEGAPALLDTAARAGIVPPGPASAIRAVLGLLAFAAGGGPVRIPVSLTDHTLALANVPVARLKTITWPVGPP